MCLWLFVTLILTIFSYSMASFLLTPHQATRLNTPWQVSMQVHGWHHCVGSIIAPNWVLTTATCTSGKIAKSLSLRVGTVVHNKGGTIEQIKTIVQHKKFNSPYHEYDFSLLELAKPLNYTNKIKPIELPTLDEVFEDGQRCIVSGWGQTRSPSAYKETGAATIVEILDQNDCNAIFQTPNIHNITDDMICAGAGNLKKNICANDMGGPLMCQNPSQTWKLTGMVSWYEQCGIPNFPAVFARVQAVREWITEKARV